MKFPFFCCKTQFLYLLSHHTGTHMQYNLLQANLSNSCIWFFLVFVSTVCNLYAFHTVQAGRNKIFQDLISGDLGFKKELKVMDWIWEHQKKDRADARKHFFLQQFGDRRSKKGAIGKIGKKATKAWSCQERGATLGISPSLDPPRMDLIKLATCAARRTSHSQQATTYLHGKDYSMASGSPLLNKTHLKIHHSNLSFPNQIKFLWTSWWINEWNAVEWQKMANAHNTPKNCMLN
jgi:hypothetical protein